MNQFHFRLGISLLAVGLIGITAIADPADAPATQATTLPATTQAADEVLNSFAMQLSESHKLPLATADQYTLTIKFDRTEYLPFEPMKWTQRLTCGRKGKPFVILDIQMISAPFFSIRRMDQPEWHEVGPGHFIGMGQPRLLHTIPENHTPRRWIGPTPDPTIARHLSRAINISSAKVGRSMVCVFDPMK